MQDRWYAYLIVGGLSNFVSRQLACMLLIMGHKSPYGSKITKLSEDNSFELAVDNKNYIVSTKGLDYIGAVEIKRKR